MVREGLGCHEGEGEGQGQGGRRSAVGRHYACVVLEHNCICSTPPPFATTFHMHNFLDLSMLGVVGLEVPPVCQPICQHHMHMH